MCQKNKNKHTKFERKNGKTKAKYRKCVETRNILMMTDD
ncbi:hypothetical protein Pint_13965 [Pistacia integerrima]|uniref:Uncharacterized protein n=1 Tax=Pistacia integerrima TaxID=434235 RepID=A0ACC0YAI6_9ROSI|nr:hypothetical protein Pint_13965 [Pistacia integerrima]